MKGFNEIIERLTRNGEKIVMLSSSSAPRRIWEQINSFEGLPTIDTLEYLDISGTAIKTFAHAQPQPHLRSFNCQETSLDGPQIGLSALVVFGDSIETVNGTPINKKQKRKSYVYRSAFLDLLTTGWILESETKVYNPEEGIHRSILPSANHKGKEKPVDDENGETRRQQFVRNEMLAAFESRQRRKGYLQRYSSEGSARSPRRVDV